VSDARTPGQIAYEAYHCECGCWRDLEGVEQQRWEAAAQAVRAQGRRPLSLLYVVVVQEGTQIQLCGAYPSMEDAESHLARARTIMPDRDCAVRVCPLALTAQAVRAQCTPQEETPC